MISLKDLNPKNHFVDETTMRNLLRLCRATVELEKHYSETLLLTSGYRNEEEQKILDPSHPHSLHCEGLAIDVSDPNGEFFTWCIDNLDFVANLGFYLESKMYTPKHVHLQLRAPVSGNRIFLP